MTSGYILIAAIFILGGIIAASGDRLGTKIGKARLRLFNLRPRQTAMVITFITGMLVSASTLGILFGLSKSLRIGIFKLDDILKELRNTKEDLVQVNQQKQQVESQLTTVKDKQIEAAGKLDAINLDFQRSKEQLKTISSRANKLRSELDNLLAEREKQLQQLEQLKGQSQQLQSQLQQREEKIAAQDKVLSEKETRLQQLKQQQQVLQTQVLEQDKSIANLDQQIALKDQNLQLRTNRLKDLESQLKFLDREVTILEEYYQTYQELRESKIAIVKGQVLSSAVVRIVDPAAAISAIDSLLRQANSNVLKAIEFQGDESPNDKSQQRVVKITKAEVKQLASQIKDGKDYVLRILSAGNYVQGEKDIRVFADIAVNQEIFKAGDEIATVSIDSERLTRSEVQERLNWLLAVVKFRAQRAGALGDIQIGDGQVATIVDFIDKITESEESVDEIQALVVETTYTAGPLKLNLVVIHNGKIVFST
jgi:uncharacterized protein (DUF3084 family)